MNRLTTILAVALLGGCAGGLQRDAPEPATYVLTPPRPEVVTTVFLPADVAVLAPRAVPELATERIATRWPGNRIDYYAGARWGGEAARVVQSALVEGLRSTGNLRSVQADPTRFRPTHVLSVELTRLEADYAAGGLPIARVEMTAALAHHPERRALASWTVRAEQPASANTLTAVMAALDEAFSRAGVEVVMGTVGAVGAAPDGQR